MWQVLKAEITYNRANFIYVLIVSASGFLLLHFWPVLFGPVPNKNVGYMSICYMYFYFVMTLFTLSWDKEKRIRCLTALPIPVRQINGAHLALFIGYWLGILALFLIFVGLSPQFFLDSKTETALLSQTGVVFSVYGGTGLMTAFRDSVWRKAGEISIILIFGFITIAGIVHSFQGKEDVHMVDRFLSWTYQSPSGSLSVLFLSIALVLFFLFLPWRKSYVSG